MIAYLFKLILASAILYGFYYLFLRQERIFHFNRFYLLLILPLSLILPQLTVKTSYVEVPAVYQAPIESSRPIASSFDLPNNSTKAVTTTPTTAPPLITWQESLATLFILISACLLVRLIRNLVRLRQFRNSGEVIQEGKHTLCLRDDISSSFTFLNTIFTNKTEFKAGKLPKEILAHEAIHAAQKHSVDIILMELLNVFLWFNPVLYLIKQSIKLNHEFLADNGVYTKHNSIPQYQQTLLHYAKINANNEPLLASRLTYGETKKRLKIMVKSTNKHITRAKVTLAFIAIAATAFFLGRERVVAQGATEELYKIWEEQNSFKYVERADSVELLMVGPFPEPEELVRLTNKDGSITKKQLNELSSTERAWLADGQSKAQFLDSKNNQWTDIGAIDRMKRWDASKPADRSLLDISRKVTQETYNLINQDSTYRFIFSNNVVIRFKDSEGRVLEKPHSKLTKEENEWLLDESAEAKVIFPKREANPPSAKQYEDFKNANKYGIWIDGKRVKNKELDKFKASEFHHFDQSKLLPNAKNYGEHTFQINLTTWEKFNSTETKENWIWYKDSIVKRSQLSKKNTPDDLYPNRLVRYVNEKGETIEKKFSELSEADQTKFKAGDFKDQQFFLPPPPPAYISEEMLNEFTNSDKYQVWLNDKQVAPKSLKDYSPNDFHHYRKIPLNNISKTRIVFITQDHWKNSGLANGTWVNYLVIKDNEPNKKENPEPQEPTNRFPAYIFHDNSKIRKLDKTGRVIENDSDVEVAKVQFFIPPTKAKPVTSKELEKLLSNENYSLWVNNTLVKDKSNLAIAPSQIHHTQDISEGQQHFVNLITTDYSELDKIENGFWLTIPESYADEFIPKYLETEDKKGRKQEANIQGRKKVKDLPQEYLTEIEESAKPQNGQHEMVIPTNLVVMFKSIEGNWVESKISQLSEEEFSYFQTPAAKAHIYSTHMGMTTPSQFPLQALGNDNWKVYVNDVAINKSEYKLYDFEKDFVKAVPNAPAPNHPDYIENVSQVAFYTDDYPKLEELKGDGWIRLDYLPGKKVFKSPSE
ncbi:M56 family metallopeptidase [Roseivirga pacifica]|uniref:M56 family metallopeptidase n=1 Tax=Roseivirga pacifica TaxID=1267423 RepID=UPI00227B6A39|nr:M56 family metallopeptidase [Roseivirga pacifica]